MRCDLVTIHKRASPGWPEKPDRTGPLLSKCWGATGGESTFTVRKQRSPHNPGTKQHEAQRSTQESYFSGRPKPQRDNVCAATQVPSNVQSCRMSDSSAHCDEGSRRRTEPPRSPWHTLGTRLCSCRIARNRAAVLPSAGRHTLGMDRLNNALDTRRSEPDHLLRLCPSADQPKRRPTNANRPICCRRSHGGHLRATHTHTPPQRPAILQRRVVEDVAGVPHMTHV